MMDPVVEAALRGALSLLFLSAAAHKGRDLSRFRATLADYRLLPAALVAAAAVAVPGTEAALAIALLVPSVRAGLVGAAALLVVYALAMGVNLARGRRDLDCGCTGPAVRRPIGGSLVVRNAVLAAAALAGLAPVRARTLVWMDGLTVAAMTAVLAALYASVDRMLANAPALARLRGDR